MVNGTVRRRLFAVGRVVLGGVFVWAGASKVGDLAGSVRGVHAYQVFPYDVSVVVGSTLPFVEIVVGLLLVVGLATRLSAAVTAALLAAFTAGIAAAWARGLAIDCGCFGGGGELAAGQTPQYGVEITRDVVLLGVATLLVLWPGTAWSVDAWVDRDVSVERVSDEVVK
jgi:uncharacterized membrane protein YphA (DoxX/SURF4 family)